MESVEKKTVSITRKLTLEVMQQAQNNSYLVLSKKNKPALRVASNLIEVKKFLKAFEEKQKELSAIFKEDEDVIEYNDKKNELITECQEKDEKDGSPLVNKQTGEALIVSRLPEFNSKLKKLKLEYSEADAKIKNMNEELNSEFEKKFDVQIVPLNAVWLKEMPSSTFGSFAFMYPNEFNSKQLPESVPSSELFKTLQFCNIEEGEEE